MRFYFLVNRYYILRIHGSCILKELCYFQQETKLQFWAHFQTWNLTWHFSLILQRDHEDKMSPYDPMDFYPIIFFLFFNTFLRSRERERLSREKSTIYDSLLKGHSLWDWARPKLGDQNSIQISHLVG